MPPQVEYSRVKGKVQVLECDPDVCQAAFPTLSIKSVLASALWGKHWIIVPVLYVRKLRHKD
jgi:hypothetical protein